MDGVISTHFYIDVVDEICKNMLSPEGEYKNMKKRIIALISAIMIIFGMVAIPKFDTQAKGTYTTRYSDGKVYIYKSGKLVDTISHDDGSVNSKYIYDEEFVYYTVRTNSGENDLYIRDIKGKKSRFWLMLPDMYERWELLERHGYILLLNAWDGSGKSAFYEADLEVDVLRPVCDAECVKKCGSYRVCVSSATSSSPESLMQIYVYNATISRVKKIENASCGYTIKGNVIRYAHNLQGRKKLSFTGPNYFSVNTYNMKTGKTKVLVKKLKADSIGKIGTRCLYYKVNSWDGNKVKYFKYDIKTKKKVQITANQYKEK